jgi:hypothetical protein
MTCADPWLRSWSLILVRFYFCELFLSFRKQPAKNRCHGVERCIGPFTPPPPKAPLMIRQQTLGAPAPFVAIPT